MADRSATARSRIAASAARESVRRSAAVGEMRHFTQTRLKDGWVMASGVPVVGFLLPRFAGLQDTLRADEPHFWLSILFASCITLVIWVSLRNWGRKRHLSSLWYARPYLGWSTYVLASAGAGFGGAYGGAWIWYQLTGLPLDLSVCGRIGWMSTILVCVLTQLYLCLYVRADLRFAARKAAELRDTEHRMRLQSSTYRQEPEAVLDSLAVLRNLVHIAPEVAVRHAQSIAGVYRYILRESSRELVILRDEIALLDRHADLLSARSGVRLSIVGGIEAARLDRFLIVPVTLHTLLECAVRARPGAASGAMTITILIEDSRLQFRVEPADSADEFAGTPAYSALNARTVAIVGSGCTVEHRSGLTVVSVPLLPISH